MTKLEILIAARELLAEDERYWTQFRNARAAGGNPVAADDEDAVSWCAIGAMLKFSPYIYESAQTFIYANNIPMDGYDSYLSVIMNWNDDQRHTYREVIAAFDRAIEAVR